MSNFDVPLTKYETRRVDLPDGELLEDFIVRLRSEAEGLNHVFISVAPCYYYDDEDDGSFEFTISGDRKMSPTEIAMAHTRAEEKRLKAERAAAIKKATEEKREKALLKTLLEKYGVED